MKISPKRRAKALWRGTSSAWSPVRLRSGQAEEDDAMLVQRLADLGHRAVVELLSDVDAGDLGAAGAGEQAYLEPRVAHDSTLPPVATIDASLPRSRAMGGSPVALRGSWTERRPASPDSGSGAKSAPRRARSNRKLHVEPRLAKAADQMLAIFGAQFPQFAQRQRHVNAEGLAETLHRVGKHDTRLVDLAGLSQRREQRVVRRSEIGKRVAQLPGHRDCGNIILRPVMGPGDKMQP